MDLLGEKRIIKGQVLFALADTLAAHAMGGFKIGVGFSLRKCRMRMCLATHELQKRYEQTIFGVVQYQKIALISFLM